MIISFASVARSGVHLPKSVELLVTEGSFGVLVALMACWVRFVIDVAGHFHHLQYQLRPYIGLR